MALYACLNEAAPVSLVYLPSNICKVLVKKQNICDFIPQRPPMVMVDCLLNSTEIGYSTSFDVQADNIFAENGHFAEPGLVENMAQTAAAGVGYLAKQQNQLVPLGFIGAIKNLEVFFLPNFGQQLKTVVTVTNQIFDISFINATVEVAGEIAAQCEMKIFISKSK